MRRKLWDYIRSRCEPGQRLPRWMLAARIALFPIETLFWIKAKDIGYNWAYNTWRIHGIDFSDELFESMANSQGELYRFERRGDTVWVTRIDPEALGSHPLGG